MKRMNLIGQKFGRLTVIESAGVDGTRSKFLCQCECGEYKITHGQSLKNGNCKSCGCLQVEQCRARASDGGKANAEIIRGKMTRRVAAIDLENCMKGWRA